MVVVVCPKGSDTIEERNEELKMACMPREGREPRGGEEETGEIDRVAAAPEPLSLEVMVGKQGEGAQAQLLVGTQQHACVSNYKS